MHPMTEDFQNVIHTITKRKKVVKIDTTTEILTVEPAKHTVLKKKKLSSHLANSMLIVSSKRKTPNYEYKTFMG